MEKMTKSRSNLDILAGFAKEYPVDIKGAARAIGVHVSSDELPDGISGKIQKLEDGSYSITVNRAEPEYRQRFTIAHELGHFMYHRSLIGDGVQDSPAYRAPDESIYENTPLERKHERQANQFAANLLMPRNLIKLIERENVGIDVRELARRLNVSEDAMRVRQGMTRIVYKNLEDEHEDDGLAELTGKPSF